MKLYVARFHDMIAGVYSTRERAEKEGLPVLKEWYGCDGYIEEFELDVLDACFIENSRQPAA